MDNIEVNGNGNGINKNDSSSSSSGSSGSVGYSESVNNNNKNSSNNHHLNNVNSSNNNINNNRDTNFKLEDETDESKPWSYFFEDYPFPNKHMTRIMLLKNKVEHYIKNRIRLPDEYRSKIWGLMEDLDKFRATQQSKEKDTFQTCLGVPNEEIENDVRMDCIRTFPSSGFKKKMRNKQSQSPSNIATTTTNNGTTQSKDSLYNVLKAYAIYNEEVQYTQGMNYLCLVLLCYFYEEDSFWMLDLLIKKHGMRHFFKKKSFLPSYLTIFELELANHLPALSQHFLNEGIQMYMFIQGWWSTIFVYILPVETISTIWDYFFWSGMGIEVLFRLSIALLKMLEPELINVKMTEFFETLKENSQKIDSLELVYQAYSIHLTVKTDHFLREVIINYQEDEMNDNIFDFQKLLTKTYENDTTTDINYNQDNYINGNNNGNNGSNGQYYNYDDDEDEEYIDYDNYYRNSVLINDSDDEESNNKKKNRRKSKKYKNQDGGNENYNGVENETNQNKSACIIN